MAILTTCALAIRHTERQTLVKTHELIRQLQEADPSGELECCVGNHDIHFVQRSPANYDGMLQVLVRDPGRKGFQIIAGIIQCQGQKVQIHTLSLQECLFEFDNNFSIEIRCDDVSNRKRAEDQIGIWKSENERELLVYRKQVE